ncbi:MAG: GNAT family N-acetyltransferase [Alphaproteobacteria bacterium]
MSLVIRAAQANDAGLVLQFIKDLAEYEKLLHEVVASEQDLVETLFGANPKAHAVIVEWQGKPVGFALYFYNYSTFLGKPGIYLEDLYVQPDYRSMGIGKQILYWLAAKAVAEECCRLQWWVLDWNEPSIEFYKKIGAVPMDEWTVFRVDGQQLKQLAAKLDVATPCPYV